MTDEQRAAYRVCFDEGHEFENCCTPFFRVYAACKNCGLTAEEARTYGLVILDTGAEL